MACFKYLPFAFTIIMTALAGCVQTTAWEPQKLPDPTVVRVLRMLLPALNEKDFHENVKEFKEPFPTLTPEQIDLSVRSLAAIYWSGTPQDYGCSEDNAVSRLGLFFGTDRANEEMMRLALYAPASAAQHALGQLVYFHQGYDLFPFFSKVLERKDLSGALIYSIIRDRQSFCVCPAQFGDVWEAVADLDLPASALRTTRYRILRDAWDKALTERAAIAKGLFENTFRSRAIALRRGRGFDGALYPEPYPGPDAEVRAVLRVLEAEIEAAYNAKLTEAQAALGRARGTKDKELWRAVRALAKSAMATGRKDVSAARSIAAEVAKHLPTVYTKWPFDAKEAKRRQQETANALGMPVQKAVDLGGGVKFELVLIPAGEFIMGSPDDEEERDYRETPHRVRVTKPFYIGKYEVTQEQWQRVMGDNPSDFEGARNPVQKVSWDDCQVFLKKLNARVKVKGTFTLATEAEWEYACRAGTQTPFYFGETISTGQVNYNGNYTYGNGRKGVYREKTIPVGSFHPNSFGLYDMHGNVSEWCGDWYDGDYYEDSPRDDPQGPARGEYRVLRGGSWYYNPRPCRCANRDGAPPDERSNDDGVRLVLRDFQ